MNSQVPIDIFNWSLSDIRDWADDNINKARAAERFVDIVDRTQYAMKRIAAGENPVNTAPTLYDRIQAGMTVKELNEHLQ